MNDRMRPPAGSAPAEGAAEPPASGDRPAERRSAERRATDSLAASFVHELRQPLMGLRAGLLLVEKRLGAAVLGAEGWTLVSAQLARLEELVSGYDELFRSEAVRPAPFAVEPVVARAVELLAHRLRPMERRFAFVAGNHQGYGAASALLHAATNLLSNALDAVEHAGGTGRIEVRVLGAPNGPVEVRVSDEGCGVPAGLEERIFEPRFTTKPPGRGTGLGLHISRRLMARCGGSVFLVGGADPGRLPWARSEFCIRLSPPPTEVAP